MPDWVPQLIITLLLAVIAYFLKSYKTQQDKRNESTQFQIDSLNKDLQDYKLKAADHFVLKDDFVRATASTDRKLDKIYDEIIKLSKPPEVRT